MIIKGKYNQATVYTDNIEQGAIGQIIELCNQEFVKGSNIAIMPDCHQGAGCVIGFTATLADAVCPSLVGVDISCGMLTVDLGKSSIDLQRLDEVIRKYIPAGFNVNDNVVVEFDRLADLRCYKALKNEGRIRKSLSSTGGGNHFIECDADDHNNKYLVVHTGSRNLGKQVAEYYQEIAFHSCNTNDKIMLQEINKTIRDYKESGRQKEIGNALETIKKKYSAMPSSVPKNLCYLTVQDKDDYLHDMKICQEFATLNRQTIAQTIMDHMKIRWCPANTFETLHNYIDLDNGILRKGAISALADELLLIPINMRDGCILGVGKGNSEWNYSAPHGAGRICSRSMAKASIPMEEYIESMKGIYTTSVSLATLDEAPMAYKPMDEILRNIQDTVDVLKILKPKYNFKAGD